MKINTKLAKIHKAYFGEFDDFSDVEREFDEKIGNIEILLAYYNYEDYSGDAYVLGYDLTNNKLVEVYGSHCSCYGLEGQWEPEDTTTEYLRKIITEDIYRYNLSVYKNALTKIVEQLEELGIE